MIPNTDTLAPMFDVDNLREGLNNPYTKHRRIELHPYQVEVRLRGCMDLYGMRILIKVIIIGVRTTMA